MLYAWKTAKYKEHNNVMKPAEKTKKKKKIILYTDS